MNFFARVVVAASVTLVLASCGSDEGGADASSSAAPDPPSGTAATTSATADETVTSVSLRRTGGLKSDPIDLSFVVGAVPPAGFTAANQDKVFEIAQKLVDAGVTLDELPANTCCDRFTYVVVVGLADGTSTTYTALDGEPVPAGFSTLLSQLAGV